MSARIAYVCADPGVPVFGTKGASVHAQEVMRALRRLGADLTLFASRLDGDAAADLRPVPCHELPLPAAADPVQREQDAIRANRRLERLLRDSGPFDLVYERHSLWSYAAMEYARAINVPALLEVNAPLIDEQTTHRTLFDRDAALDCAARAFASATAVVAVSEAAAAYAARGGARAVHVIPNAADTRRYSPHVAPSSPAPPGVLTAGFVGSMKAWHGVDVLLEAFAAVHEELPASRLLLVGDGPERARLRGLHPRVAEATVATGAVPPQAVPALLTSIDVAVAPYPGSADFYFSPLKVFEYMAAGRAIVASRTGQLSDVIEDGVSGVLCPPGDSAALADSIMALFRDEPQRRRLGAAARERACRSHTWDAVAARILTIAEGSRAGLAEEVPLRR